MEEVVWSRESHRIILRFASRYNFPSNYIATVYSMRPGCLAFARPALVNTESVFHRKKLVPPLARLSHSAIVKRRGPYLLAVVGVLYSDSPQGNFPLSSLSYSQTQFCRRGSLPPSPPFPGKAEFNRKYNHTES